ncbi:respiratory nitrate reductase subunit gamma [Actinoplanes sp. NPDC051411]|uniref:respiratory nitrate reductase subunit gamma n=1 Tax=Actinoplanes sp. NPDC051411 TaxID=3155522 RepID=UPI0034171AE2
MSGSPRRAAPNLSPAIACRPEGQRVGCWSAAFPPRDQPHRQGWACPGRPPFSRLVLVFSAPPGYLTRPYIVYRSRDVQLGSRPARRGWERVG